MHHNALMEFLVPSLTLDGTDELQFWIRLTFFVLIFSLTLATILCVARSAQETSWDKNWKEVALSVSSSGQLDVEHGSVNEISLAIRTRSEAMASMMPGVILVIGLLGTFIGLGLALTEASLAITAPSVATAPSSPTEMSEPLSNMIKGLGYKFATSTWGILAYLILQAFSALRGFDRKRLRFAAGKMRKQLDIVRNARLSTAQTDRAHYSELIERIERGVRATGESSAATLAVLSKFLDGMEENIEQMSASSTSMAQSADSVNVSAGLLGDSATALQNTVDRFDTGVRSTLDDVKSGLTQAIADLSSTTTRSMDRIASDLREVTTRLSDTLKDIQGELTTTLKTIESRTAESNAEIAKSLLELSASVDKTLSQLHTTMEQAAEVNQRANRNFEANTTRILALTFTTEQMVKSIQQDIVGALKSVADGNFQTRNLFFRFESIANRNEIATNALVDALNALRVPPPASESAVQGQRPTRPGRRRTPK